MGVRDGKSYVSRLKAHPREVWVAGRKVSDVTEDPVFRRPIAAMAQLYDMQGDAELHSTMTYLPDDSAEPAGVSFIIPKTHADLVHRRKAMRVWADATFGTMGRSPDFLNTVLVSMADAPDVFAECGANSPTTCSGIIAIAATTICFSPIRWSIRRSTAANPPRSRPMNSPIWASPKRPVTA